MVGKEQAREGRAGFGEKSLKERWKVEAVEEGGGGVSSTRSQAGRSCVSHQGVQLVVGHGEHVQLHGAADGGKNRAGTVKTKQALTPGGSGPSPLPSARTLALSALGCRSAPEPA